MFLSSTSMIFVRLLTPIVVVLVGIYFGDVVVPTCDFVPSADDSMYNILRRVPDQLPNVGLRIQNMDTAKTVHIIAELSNRTCLSVNVSSSPLNDSVELRDYLNSISWVHPRRILIIQDVDRWGVGAKDALKGLIEDGEAGAQYNTNPLLVLVIMKGSRAAASHILPDRVVHKLSEISI